MGHVSIHSSQLLNDVKELYKRSLIALCGMVVHHEEYIAQRGAAQVSATLEMAKTIASAVLDRFGLGSLKKYRLFLSKGDIFDRGEEVDVHGFLRLLDAT